jgi:ABC-type amino acid transport substrate-binding protein
LTTVLQLVGAPQFAAGMGTAAAAAGTLAAAEGTATVATEGLTVAAVGLDAVLAPLIALAAPLLTVAAGMAFISKAVHEFADVQSRAFQTSVVLKNLGSSIPIEELQSLGSEIQRLTGFDDDLVVSLGGMLARFGIAGKEIPGAVRAIADAAAGSGQSLEEIGSAVGHALAGRGQALKQLGVEFKATGNKAQDLLKIESELEKRFAGAGAARRDTITGAFDALQNATGNFFSAVGRILGPGMIKLLNFFADKIQLIADKLEALADRLHIARPQDAAAGIGGKGLKGDPQQTALLGQIADNTGKTADNFVRAVLGGKGDIARRAGSWRDAGIALGT